MDEKAFAVEFLAKNLDRILQIARLAYAKVDEITQVNFKTAYIEYLTSTREKYSKAKSFFIRNDPVDLYEYYVPTGVYCGSTIFSSPTFRECISHSKRLIITGSGGSGKSVFIKHLFLNCIADKEYAPILVELRDLNDDTTLNDFIVNTLETFGFNVSGEYVLRAKQAGHFCFFFDGYDEVTPKLRKKVIEQIKYLSKKFPECPIILSSRPDDSFNGIEEFSIFKMMPLSLNSAVSLVEKLPFDLEIKTKFVKDLKNQLFEKHRSFLSNPLLLSIMLLTYGENAEIPTKLSIFYNQAYEALFQRHDANKAGYSRERLTSLDIQDFSRVFSLFALQTYDKRLFKMSRSQCLEFIEKSRISVKKNFSQEDYLIDLLSAACLMTEDGLEIAFSHRSFQEYFVALHISNSPIEIQRKLIDRYWKNMRYDSVFNLLLEINPDLVEREFFVPNVEKFFNKIGVKREVGVTHVVRYLKTYFTKIDIQSVDDSDEPEISATFRSTVADESEVLHMFVRHCNEFKYQSNQDKTREICARHGKEGESVQYSTDELSHKSQLFIDINSLNNGFSKNYLTCALRSFKAIKAKHDNVLQNLDVLLGIS